MVLRHVPEAERWQRSQQILKVELFLICVVHVRVRDPQKGENLESDAV